MTPFNLEKEMKINIENGDHKRVYTALTNQVVSNVNMDPGSFFFTFKLSNQTTKKIRILNHLDEQTSRSQVNLTRKKGKKSDHTIMPRIQTKSNFAHLLRP